MYIQWVYKRLSFMRCGRPSVEGEAEDIVSVSPKAAKPRQRGRHHEKRNPYSSVGLDTFASLNVELSAKREHVARKTGTPEDMVWFAFSPRGWVPVVVNNGDDGPIRRTKQDNPSKENNNSLQEEEEEDNPKEGDEGYENGSTSIQEIVPVILPWWSGYLRTAAFGVPTVSDVLVRKPAAAMGVAMVVGSLQKLCLGGVLCMKRLIDSGNSYFSVIFSYWIRSSEIQSSPPQGSLQEQQQLQPVASPDHKIIISKRLTLICPTVRGQATALSSPKNSRRSQKLNTQLQGKKKFNDKKKKSGRIVSMDGQPRMSVRLQQSDGFVGATVMIVLLFFLVFYGRLSAILFTSTWWYVFLMLRTDSSNPFSSHHNNNNRVVMDLESREYKKKVIMDGLLQRNHGRAI